MRTRATVTGEGIAAGTLGEYRTAAGGVYEVVKNIGLLLVAPFIGLTYFIVLPLAGFCLCGKYALQAALQ